MANKSIKYTFPSSIDEFKSTSKNRLISFFFQISTFKNNNGKYHMRKFIISDKNEFINIEDYMLSHNQCKRFYKSKNINQYRMYNTVTLNNINPPTLNDIYTANSSNLKDYQNNLSSMYLPFTNDYNQYSPNNTNNTNKTNKIMDIDQSELNDNIVSDYSKF